MSIVKLVHNNAAPFIVEDSAYEGVKRITDKVRVDIEKVTNILPARQAVIDGEVTIVIVGTVGRSTLLNDLEEAGKICLAGIKDKREVYQMALVQQPFPGVEAALVIAGSDKRGTIYGLFELSEKIGVTAYHYWGDVTPRKYQEVLLISSEEQIEEESLDQLVLPIEAYVSKEPSVKYRGFFINDEWPCFGNWTFSHFDGFTAKMYEHVFEFLLRLKGNYLWPAMWTSSFGLDGPGLESAELADIYGVVIGNSHHEPCLRASEEWDIYKGEDTPYGTEWNYATNGKGLSQYWAGGLQRSGQYESLITIGMRGERDSSMLGPDATLEDNIELLKEIITEQRKLIKAHVNEDIMKVPQLLALYKEVEAYFYGDETVAGLREWEELEGVTFMLCEDNFGNMRTLPTTDLKDREGGWGMYYHFDYHGGPISYEWVNSTRLAKVWEQMTMAYEYGVKEVWIVNVGDLKFNEVPLGYFMALAYDFDKWGTNAPNMTGNYLMQWMKAQFGGDTTQAQLEDLCEVMTEYSTLNSLRRPEALNSTVYHPTHYDEGNRMLQRVESLKDKAIHLKDTLPDRCQDAYYSMIYYPAICSANLLEMHLAAGINELYARQGRPLANKWAERVKACIQKDDNLAKEWAVFLDGKWSGMEKAHHIGFMNWNDQDYRYPVCHLVEPAREPRLVVLKQGEVRTYTSSYFRSALEVTDFLDYGCEEVRLQLVNGGVGSYQWEAHYDCKWLSLSESKGEVTEEMTLVLRVLEEHLTKEEDQTLLTIQAGNEKVYIEVMARKWGEEDIPEGTFMPRAGVVTIEAAHYVEQNSTPVGSYKQLEGYGRTLSGMKAYPVTSVFGEDEAPSLTYGLWAEEKGSYVLELHTAPSNPIRNQGTLCVGIKVNEEETVKVDTIPEGYRSGDPDEEQWCEGVLDGIHKTFMPVSLEKGYNTITLLAVDAPLVLERLMVYLQGNQPKLSYLGPLESKKWERKCDI